MARVARAPLQFHVVVVVVVVVVVLVVVAAADAAAVAVACCVVAHSNHYRALAFVSPLSLAIIMNAMDFVVHEQVERQRELERQRRLEALATVSVRDLEAGMVVEANVKYVLSLFFSLFVHACINLHNCNHRV